MPDDDLIFKLKVDTDTSDMEAALARMGKQWDALGQMGKAQLDSIAAHAKFTEAFKAPEVIDPRVEHMKTITAEMEKQRSLLDRINIELDPTVLKERVALEKQLSEAKINYQQAHKQEQINQGIPQPGFMDALKQGVGPAASYGLEKAADAIGPVGVAIAGVGAASVVAYKALKELAGGIAGLVGVASPAVFRQWELTIRDLQGVIGQTLLPVLEIVTEAVRLLADVLANILPSTQEMREALAPLRLILEAVGTAVRALFAVFGPFIRLGIQVAIVAITVLTVRLALLAVAAAVASRSARDIAIAVGVLAIALAASAADAKGRSSVGAAARPGRISTGEEYQRGNIEAALNSFGGQTIPQKQLTTLEQIRDLLARQQKSTINQPGLAPKVDPHGINRALGFN